MFIKITIIVCPVKYRRKTMKNYVKNQGKNYNQTYSSQPTLFDDLA